MARGQAPYKGALLAQGVDEFLDHLSDFSEDKPLPDHPLEKSVDDESQERWRNDCAPYRNAFVVLTLGWFDRAVEITRQWIKRVKDDAPPVVKELRQQTRDLEQVDRLFYDAAAARRFAEQRLRNEFDRLRGFPKVANARIDKDMLVIETKTLIITAQDGSRWDIGGWKIHLPRRGNSSDIRCFSLQTPAPKDHNGWYHPHVSYNNVVCWGNAGATIDMALLDAQYDIVVELVIAVLDSGREYNWNQAQIGHDYGIRLREVAKRIR